MSEHDPDPHPIMFMETFDILRELGRRHEALVVITARDLGASRPGEEIMGCWSSGPTTRCLGLAHYAAGKLGRLLETSQDFDSDNPSETSDEL